MSKLRPILFSTPMVQAILEGRKTQTRRIMKPQPISYSEHVCPYGKVGDVLWVRETFGFCQPYGPESLHWKYKTGERGDSVPTHLDWYRFDPDKWKPSIHMPFEACRLFLEITNIRVDRLQEISENDAIKEGLIFLDYKGHSSYTHNRDTYPNGFGTATGCFSHLWQSVYGTESWQSNPWVWVIEFKKIPKPIALLTPTR